MSSESNVKEPIKRITGPRAAIAGFIRPRDRERIWVFKRRRETNEQAITRVMKHNGAEGGVYELCN